MYTLQLFAIGYTREAHRHFVSKVAEDTFFNKYALHSAPITCERVFNPKAREFSINISEIPEYEQASYLIATHKGKFYYYYITDYNVINGITVVYKVEEDIYHTYFNNRGDFFNFSGRLSQSNTKSDIVYYPTGKAFKKTNQEIFFESHTKVQNRYYTALIYINLQKDGLTVLRSRISSPAIRDAIMSIYAALNQGKLYEHLGETTKELQTFSLIGAYIVPSELLEEKTDFTTGIYWTTYENTFFFYSAKGKQVVKKVIPNKKTSNYFGTPFNKLNYGNSENEVTLSAQLFTEDCAPSLIISVNNTEFLDVIDDFTFTAAYSQYAQYLAQNKATFALNSISALVGIVTSVVTHQPLTAFAGVMQLAQMGANINEASNAEHKIVNAVGNVVATVEKSSLLGLLLMQYSTEKQEIIDKNFVIFGGECSGKDQTFSDIVSIDGDKNVYKSSGFFYRFSYIESGNGGTLGGSAFMNKIADMFTSGIRIYYIQE